MKHSYTMYTKREINKKPHFFDLTRIQRIIVSLLVVMATTLFSCERDEVFQKEQYKNVVALISESDNVSRKFHSLGEESVGYVAASVGGTNPTTKNIIVNLVEDHSFIDAYNKTNYDLDKRKYVRTLPKSKYDIDSYQFTIPAGEIGGRLPIRIRPDGLSPDSAYFISLRLESASAYEVNPSKSYVLYRVRIKNWWAVGDGSSSYSMNIKQRESGSTSEIQMPGRKIMHPISENQVRIMAGNETYASDINVFNKFALVLTIGEDNKVTISSYKDVEVTQIDGDSDFPNIFRIEDDGYKKYKSFLLKYSYKSGNKTLEIKEELRLEYNEAEETEEN